MAFREIPGGKFADGGIEFAERPAGIFAGSSLISLPAIFALTFELEFAFDGTLGPQPKLTIEMPIKTNAFLNRFMQFKILVPV